jgi:GT2 family glycosyltransferase
VFSPAYPKPPLVTALIVVRNECEAVGPCLACLIAQDLPPEEFEILVVDGHSSDGTPAEVRRLAYEAPHHTLRLLDNAQRTLATGWNLGIREARGEFVVRLDAHATAPPDFLRANLALHREHEAACVGGPMGTVGVGYWGQCIAAVLSSRMGVGTSFRSLGDYEGEVDTVPFGMYRRSVLLEVGLLNESMGRNQDIELHRRMRDRGYRFFMSPRVRTTYYCRGTVGRMCTQAYHNGFWHAAALGAMRPRHAAPAVAVAAAACLGTAGLLGSRPAWWALGAASALHLLLSALAAASSDLSHWTQRLILPSLFVLLHASYGVGTLAGVVGHAGRLLRRPQPRSAT